MNNENPANPRALQHPYKLPPTLASFGRASKFVRMLCVKEGGWDRRKLNPLRYKGKRNSWQKTTATRAVIFCQLSKANVVFRYKSGSTP